MSSKPKTPHKTSSKKAARNVKSALTAPAVMGIPSSQKPIYQQVDKVEFFVPTSGVEDADTPTRSTLVAIPVTNGNQLRMVKIKSCRVYVWNRGPHDLYLEVLQPFGAHANSNTVVAWGPVTGRRNRPQSRWTIKANKAAGMFKIDLTDNNFTLPATVKATPSGQGAKERLCLALFAFAVTRNKVTFTGTSDTKSSRAIQFKIVLDYWGVDLPQENAVLMKGTYSDMGATSAYPIQDANDVYRNLGLISLERLTGIRSFVSQDHSVVTKMKSTGKIYTDLMNGEWTPDDNVNMFAQAVPENLRIMLDKLSDLSGRKYFPITPVQGLLWKTDDDNLQDHILMGGVGDVLVRGDQFPTFQRPSDDHWYVGSRYVNRGGSVNFAPMIFGDTSSKHDIYNNYARVQPMHSNRVVVLDRLMPFAPQWQAYAPELKGLFCQSAGQRLLVTRNQELQSSVGGFALGSWIAMITVIIKVIEAAYNAYETYSPQNVGDVFQLPGHKAFADRDDMSSWCVL